MTLGVKQKDGAKESVKSVKLHWKFFHPTNNLPVSDLSFDSQGKNESEMLRTLTKLVVRRTKCA